MEYFETKNINLDEVLSSWRMNNKEIEDYIIESRKSLHKFMPTPSSLNQIMDEDEKKLRTLLTLNDNYFVVIDNNKIVGIVTLVDNKSLTYVVPFKYQRKVHIIGIIREIMTKYDIEKIIRIEELDQYDEIKIPKQDYNHYDEEMNIIKRTIDYLLNSGYAKEDILNNINEYMKTKTYQKK